jgi:4-hydroxybenzoate polyprenyltransferase
VCGREAIVTSKGTRGENFRMKPASSIIVLWLTLLPPNVDSFSAHLSRPWEPPTPSNVLLLMGKKRSKYSKAGDESSTEQKASATDDDVEATMEQDDPVRENSTAMDARDNDGHESMSLQDDHVAIETPQVFVATASSSPALAAAVTGASTTSTPITPTPTVLSCWRPLLAMTRPSNFLGVVMFHLLGTHLATKGTKESMTLLLSTPTMCVVLFTLLLTSATSMVVNDYYDTKLGVDSLKRNKPLVIGHVPMAVAKRFLYYLYAALLFSLTVVPGVPARLSVVVGLMLTFWYTKHLKPITWLKNVVCASLMALSPLTSGSAALATASANKWHVLTVLPLWRLTGMLFCGFLGREIMMDINDVVDDRLHKVKTVPVKYGRKFAAQVSLVATAVMAGLALAGKESSRQLVFAGIGSSWMLYRAWQVLRVQGEDRVVVDRAVEDGKLAVMMLLASFV